MISISRLFWAGCLAVLCFGCTIPTGITKTNSSPNPPASSQSGSLSINIPATADWLLPFLKNTAASSSSRAMLYATSVKVSVTDTNGYNVITPVTQSLAVSTATGGSSASLTAIAVPAGTGYTVSVSVYNSAYYDSDYPTVTGSVSNVTIVKGQTTTEDIFCKPYVTSTLVPNVLKSTNLPGQGEEWYKFTSLASQKYTLSAGHSSAPLFLFSSDGSYLATATNAQSHTWTTTEAVVYYVGIANTTAGVLSGSTLLSSVLPPANEGTTGAPVALVTDSSEHTFILGPNQASDQTSYYTFTTTEAGDFYFYSASGYAHWTLGTDSSFVVSTQTGYYTGAFWMKNLAAGTIYYLKLTNADTVPSSFVGKLLKPSDLASATKTEGSPSFPLALTLGTGHAGQVGDGGYNRNSYYSFNTGTGRFYSIGISSITGSDSIVDYTVSPYPSFTSYSFSGTSTGTVPMRVLEPNTTYFLSVQVDWPSGSLTEQTSFSLLVKEESAPVGTNLVLDTDTPSSMAAANSVQVFDVTVPAEGNYVVAWGDYNNRSSGSTYSADVSVAAYSDDYSTASFSGDSGYSTSVYSGGGTYTIRVNSPHEGSLVVNVH